MYIGKEMGKNSAWWKLSGASLMAGGFTGLLLCLLLLLSTKAPAAEYYQMINEWATIDSITTLNTDKPYLDAHQRVPEALTILPGVPQSPDSVDVSKDQDSVYIINGFILAMGHLTYTGDQARDFLASFSGSITSSANNITVDFLVGINGVPVERTRISRKVGTGSDEGSVAGSVILKLYPGDYVDVFLDVSAPSVITMEHGLYILTAVD